jgi:hypothetical protein
MTTRAIPAVSSLGWALFSQLAESCNRLVADRPSDAGIYSGSRSRSGGWTPYCRSTSFTKPALALV